MEKLYFDKIKEKHDSLIVEYNPPAINHSYAMLSITSIKPIELIELIDRMESLTEKWIERYPVPLMASAFDQFGALIDLTTKRKSNHLIGIPRNGSIEYHWELANNNTFDSKYLNTEYLKSIYTDINYRTQEDINLTVSNRIKPIRRLKVILIIWAIFIPALITILEFFSPPWLALIALFYSLYKAYRQWSIMTGRKKKSESELATDKEEALMKHHHYHCKLNPDGFLRLKNENVKAEARKDVHDEFNSL